ncbi:MAG: gfo/Idh/MocA family oxidoreductase [Thermodesulfovibrio sp.]|nr:gfo/Idh/MocA family oxidoreductase [Thermodesulfovibrio sp.]
MKVLFIGLGSIGQRHMRAVKAKFGENVTVFAYRVRDLRKTISSDMSADEGTDFIKKYSVEVFTDLNRALAQSPDVAFICNPTSGHISSCLAVVAAGCDFIVEKPLSHSMDGVDKLISICRSKGIVSLVGFQFRFHPCYRLLKNLIYEGAIGNLLSVRAEIGEYLPGIHKYEDYRCMYAARNDLGGGVILTQIHEIDYLYDLFGLPAGIFAVGGHLSGLEIDVEDVADVLMDVKYKDRILPVSLHMDYIQTPPSRNCRIIGESGKITMDLVGSKVILERTGRDVEIRDVSGFERDRLFVDEIDHFFECVATRKPTIVTLEDGRNSLRIALAVKESMRSGRVVKLNG